MTDMPPNGKHRGHFRHYRVSPPMSLSSWSDEPAETSEHVIVSAADVEFSGPETYIFLADANGKITNWMECSGSFRGALDHERALREAGYAVIEEAAGDAPALTDFRLTFYGTNWALISAPDDVAARKKAIAEFGTAWCDLYAPPYENWHPTMDATPVARFEVTE